MIPTGRAALVQQHGRDPIAYSTLQNGLEYFDTSFGYVAYHSAWGTALTLGPPVCAPADQRELTERFLRHRRDTTFFYLPHHTAMETQALAGKRFRTAVIGVDRVVPTSERGLTQDPRVRGALRKAAAAGMEVVEVPPHGLDRQTRARVLALNAEYLQTHPPGSELRFLNRPLDLDHDADGLSRLFVFRWEERGVRDLRAFARLNPYFEAGRVRGYLLDVFRLGRTRLWGVFLSAVVHLARRLDVPELSLGFCPLHVTPTRGTLLEREVGWLARHLEAVPYVARLRANKAAFPGEDQPRCLLTRGSALRSFLALLSASGAPLRSIAARSVLSSIARPYLGTPERT